MRIVLFIITIIATLLLVAAVDISTGSWFASTILYFIDLPSLGFVLFSSVLVTVIIHPYRDLVTAVALSLGFTAECDKPETIRAARALRFLGRMSLWNGVGISLVQAIVSAQNAASVTGLFAALAVSALAMLYGLIILLVCSAGVQIVKIRLGEFIFYLEE